MHGGQTAAAAYFPTNSCLKLALPIPTSSPPPWVAVSNGENQQVALQLANQEWYVLSPPPPPPHHTPPSIIAVSGGESQAVLLWQSGASGGPMPCPFPLAPFCIAAPMVNISMCLCSLLMPEV